MHPRFRFAALIVCTGMLLSLGCAKAPATPAAVSTPNPVQSTAAAPAPTDASPATPKPSEPSRARQYGEAMALTADHNGFTGALLYPLGDIDVINQVLSEWATTAFAEQETFASSLDADSSGIKATLNVDYDAYEVFGRFYGIKETGQLVPTRGKPVNILFTYNYDTIKSQALTLTDVIIETALHNVAQLLTDRLLSTDGSALSGKTALDATDLNRFVIRSDGVEWLFSGAQDVVSVTLDYGTLKPFLILDFQSPATPASADATVSTSAAEEGKPAIEQTALSLYDGVHVRSGPSEENTSILGVLGEGERVDVIRSNSARGWHQIWYNGQIAYVFATLVRLSNDGDAYTTGWVTASYLHVRATPDVNGALLGTLQNAERVSIADPNPANGWYKIWFEGRYAYAFASYIHIGSAPVDAAPATQTAAPADVSIAPRIVSSAKVNLAGVGTCTTNGVVIRSEPSLQAPQYGKLYRGDQVYLIKRLYLGQWDEIFVFTSSARGYTGYVHSKYVQSDVPADNSDSFAG